jgi:hypothetical protein
MALPDIEVGDEVTADLLDTLPAGIIYQGNRASAAGPTVGSTELGILRIDDMVLKAGREYEFKMGNFRATFSSTTATDKFKINLRYSAAGSATIASGEIGRCEAYGPASASNWPHATGWVIPPSDTTTASILISMIRVGGTGTLTTLADTGGLWLSVIDHGVAVTDTGIDV